MKGLTVIWFLVWLLTAAVTPAQTVPNISGEVIDEAGAGVSNADVWLVPNNGSAADLASTKTGPDGKFELATTKRVESVSYAVVVWKAGFGVGHAVNRTSEVYSRMGAVPQANDLSIHLPRRATPFQFQVVAPDGSPVRNAPVAIRSVTSQKGGNDAGFYTLCHTGLPCLSRSTDSDGMVSIDFLPLESYVGFSVTTDALGVQIATATSNQPQRELKLRLLPSSRIRIQLKAKDATPVAGRELTYWARLPNAGKHDRTKPRLEVTYGNSVLLSNENGMVEANILAGTVDFSLTGLPEDTSFADLSNLQKVVLESNKVTELEVEFRPGVRVTGRVVDGDGNPVEGVTLRANSTAYKTDKAGRYEVLANPQGWTSIQTVLVPEGFAMPYENYGRSVNLPNPDAKLEQEDIVIEHAVTVTGMVVDAQEQPVAGAVVRAAWQATGPSGSSYTRKSIKATSDPGGQFVLRHVLKDVEVMVSAETSDTASAAETIHTDADKQLELRVQPEGTMRLVGTVRGKDGEAIEDAQVRLTQAMLTPDGQTYGNRRIQVNGRDHFGATESGRFVSPIRLPRFGRYSIKVGAPGYLSKETTYLSADEGDLEFGVLELIRSRIAKGVVVDTKGSPIVGAKVSAYSAEKIDDYSLRRTGVETDSGGRFSIDGLHPLAAVAIIEQEGYRTSGAFLIEGADIRVTLFRPTESTTAEYRIAPRKLDALQRNTAARSMLAGLLEQRRGSNYFHVVMCQMLLRISHDDAVAELDHIKSASIRTSLLKDLGEAEDALAESANISDPFSRCTARVHIARQSDDEKLWRDALSLALAESELIQRPDRRIFAVCAVADAFYEKGDREHAEKIVRGQLAQAKELSTDEWPGFARGRFAEELVRFDFEQAMELLQQAAEDDRHRHYQNIAHRLADINPSQAEQVLRKMKPSNWVQMSAVRVAYRMASVDIPRALSLLDTIDDRRRPVARARAFGVMAMAIADQDIGKARELLAQGFEAIPKVESRGGGDDDALGAAMTLLRYAEQIDPENLADHFWQTAKRYSGPLGNAWSPDQREEKDADRQAKLAILLGLYSTPDDILQQVTEPIFEHWEKELAKPKATGRFDDYEASFMAMALANPHRAADWAIAFDKKLDKTQRRRIPQPWEVVGNTLTKDRTALGKQLTREVYHRWVIDQYDL